MCLIFLVMIVFICLIFLSHLERSKFCIWVDMLQFLFEAGYGSSHSNSARSGIIGVTQPRRVAAYATAERVAYELGLNSGKEVGFQVRHDKRMSKSSCSIKFMTDGILLQELKVL